MKIIKISLILLILILSIGFASASDDSIAEESLLLSDESSISDISQDPSDKETPEIIEYEDDK